MEKPARPTGDSFIGIITLAAFIAVVVACPFFDPTIGWVQTGHELTPTRSHDGIGRHADTHSLDSIVTASLEEEDEKSSSRSSLGEASGRFEPRINGLPPRSVRVRPNCRLKLIAYSLPLRSPPVR